MITNVRYIRKLRNMTLKELGEKTGFTVAYLSLIERDKRDPTISTLIKIAEALGVSTESLWTTLSTDEGALEQTGCIFVPRDARPPAKRLIPGIDYESITVNSLEEGRSVGLIGHVGILGAHSSTNPNTPAVHEEDELTYMLCGDMLCVLSDSTLEITAGDTFLIKRNTPHNFVNNGDAPVEFLTVRYVQPETHI